MAGGGVEVEWELCHVLRVDVGMARTLRELGPVGHDAVTSPAVGLSLLTRSGSLATPVRIVNVKQQRRLCAPLCYSLL